MKTPDELIAGYLDDDLSESDAAALRRWLVEDRRHLRAFILATHQHRALRSVSLAAANSTAPDETMAVEGRNPAGVTTPAFEPAVVGMPASGSRRGPSIHWRIGLAAVVVLVGSLFWLSHVRSSSWTAPIIGTVEGNAALQIEDTRLSRRLSQKLLASRFAWVRVWGARLQSRIMAVDRLTPGSVGPGTVLRLTGTQFTGEDIEAEDEPGLTLAYPNDSTKIRLRANTSLRLLSASKGRRFELLSGILEIETNKQPADEPLRVATRFGDVTVTGTKLAVVTGGRSTRVQVSEGHVRLNRPASRENIVVVAGERAVAATDSPVRLETLRAITNHHGSGSILREQWSNVPGRFLRDEASPASFQAPPDRTETVGNINFANRVGVGEDAYVARYRGYLHAPVSGEYTFWVAADDTGELWLSRDENPETKELVCQAREWSLYFQNWWQFPDQESAPVHLEAGRRYYIEALHKEGGGGDFFSVAWQPPGAGLEVIPGAALAPFEPPQLVRQ